MKLLMPPTALHLPLYPTLSNHACAFIKTANSLQQKMHPFGCFCGGPSGYPISHIIILCNSVIQFYSLICMKNLMIFEVKGFFIEEA